MGVLLKERGTLTEEEVGIEGIEEVYYVIVEGQRYFSAILGGWQEIPQYTRIEAVLFTDDGLQYNEDIDPELICRLTELASEKTGWWFLV